MRFIAESASTEVDLQNSRFNPQALQQMAEQVDGKGIPIARNFNYSDRVGFVTRAYVKNNRLIVEGELSVGLLTRAEGYVVPGVRLRDGYSETAGLQQGLIKVDTDVELVCFGLTDKPCDTTLKPLKEMEVRYCVST